MKNYLLKMAACGLMFIALTLFSCQRESVDSSGTPSEVLGKARKAFESSYLSGTKLKAEIAARSIHPDDPNERLFFVGYKLDPINFAPKWDKARVNSKYDDEVVVDVPIAPEYYFKAFWVPLSPDEEPVGDRDYGSLVTQKLTIAFAEGGNADGVYSIASIVPDPEYFYAHPAIAQECNIGGDMGSFTGIVLFHSLAGELQKVERYDDGIRVKCITRESFGSDIDGFASAVVPLTVEFVMGRSFEILNRKSLMWIMKLMKITV